MNTNSEPGTWNRERPTPVSAFLLGVALWAAALPAAGDGVQIRSVDGQLLRPFAPAGAANAIFFIQSDCPISNWYAPVVQQVCRDYASRGVGCTLVYEDVDLAASPNVLDGEVRQHLKDYRYSNMTAAIDRARTVARHAKVSVTPSVAVVDRAGVVRYRGRIDNAYADLGKPRRQVTSHDLREALEAVIARRPVRNPDTQALGCFIVDPGSVRKK
jgi:hypothetical protein